MEDSTSKPNDGGLWSVPVPFDEDAEKLSEAEKKKRFFKAFRPFDFKSTFGVQRGPRKKTRRNRRR